MLYIVSSSYEPDINAIVLKLYDDETQKIIKWVDPEYKAYFLSANRVDESEFKGEIISQEIVTKYNGLTDENVNLWKVSVDNPLAVKKSEEMAEIHENHIKFYQNYIHDKDVKMGMPHKLERGALIPQVDTEAERRVVDILSGITKMEDRNLFETWARLLEYPAPIFKRTSLDIEVLNEVETQIPDAEVAIMPIILAGFVTNDGEKIALVLVQDKKELKIPDNVTKVEIYSDEKELVMSIFAHMREFPFIFTFNGDGFDLKYIYHRALRLGIPKEEIPIQIREEFCILNNAVHIDLYKFFFIRAIKIYAFKGAYDNIDLDTISKALLKKGKLKGDEKWVAKMTYHDLIRYCVNDAELTYELTEFNDDLVMNLILVLTRLSRLPMENVSRNAISTWIKSFLYHEHRLRNMLIPNPEDIMAIKGKTASQAIIKGKKYRGAVVVEPKSGIHFIVKVLDFASLYPSIIKVYNIGYATINCPHEECKKNTIGELPHWICTKHRAVESLVIGSLRDLRVFRYKQKAKDKSLNEKQQKWYSVVEQSIKVLMNASYGVLGAESFPFYCPPAAEEITAIARFIIEQTIHQAESMGIEVIYGDTDSIFVENPTKEQLEELIKWVWEKFTIEFEVDKSYRYAVLSSRKKNYLGVFDNGEVDTKGLTGKKKHTPPLIRNTFEETKKILGQVFSPQDMTISKVKIIDLVKSLQMTIRTRSWKDMSDLAFDVTISKDLDEYVKTVPQHVKAAKKLIEEGYEVGSGSNIKFIKTFRLEAKKRQKKGATETEYKKPISDVKPVELATREEVDIDKYMEFMQSTFEQVLDPLDIDFNRDILGLTKIETVPKKKTTPTKIDKGQEKLYIEPTP